MKGLLMTVGIAWAIAATAAPPAPLGFKDLVLGQPLGSGEVAAALECGDRGACIYLPRGTNPDVKIAGALAASVYVSLRDGVIDSIDVQYSSSVFDDVRAGLRAKYPALQCRDIAVETSGGGVFADQICRLATPAGELKATQYSGSLDWGHLSITSKGALDREAQKAAKAVHDL